jgi:hypothetical protein
LPIEALPSLSSQRQCDKTFRHARRHQRAYSPDRDYAAGCAARVRPPSHTKFQASAT